MSEKFCPVCSAAVAGDALICAKCGIVHHLVCARTDPVCASCQEPWPVRSTGSGFYWVGVLGLIAGLALVAVPLYARLAREAAMRDGVALRYRIKAPAARGSEPRESLRAALSDRLHQMGEGPFTVEDATDQPDQVVIRLPKNDPRHQILKDLLTAREPVQFNEVLAVGDSVADVDSSEPDTIVLYEHSSKEAPAGSTPRRRCYLLKKQPVMTGEHLLTAEVMMGELGSHEIHFEFDETGSGKMKEMSRRLKGKQVAIVLAGRLYMAPEIQGEIGARVQITGKFNLEEARMMVRVLRARPLPAELTLVP